LFCFWGLFVLFFILEEPVQNIRYFGFSFYHLLLFGRRCWFVLFWGLFKPNILLCIWRALSIIFVLLLIFISFVRLRDLSISFIVA